MARRSLHLAQVVKPQAESRFEQCGRKNADDVTETNRVGDFDHETDRSVRAQQIYQTIDRQGFQWVVVFVAGIGFFLVSLQHLCRYSGGLGYGLQST